MKRWLHPQGNDGVLVAFARASDAVAAAFDVQRAFRRENWPNGVSLKLRGALQTAHAQRHDEANCFRRAINRCIRLRAVAHGGRVLLSRATRNLVVDRLPEHAELTDLGVHRLGDFGPPEHVFGLGHPELPAEFPHCGRWTRCPTTCPVS